MARPPIIISNGGVIGVLKTGLKSTTSLSVEDQIKKNVNDLNEKSHNQGPNHHKDYANRSIIRLIESANKNDPRILWCLASEDIQDLKNNLTGLECSNSAELSG